MRHRSVSFPRREQYNSFRQIVQRFFAVPGRCRAVPYSSRALLCGSPALLCGSLWFPVAVVQFPRRKCAVPGGVKVTAKVQIQSATLSLWTARDQIEKRMTKLNERRSQIGGGALFASAGGGFVDPELTGMRFAV